MRGFVLFGPAHLAALAAVAALAGIAVAGSRRSARFASGARGGLVALLVISGAGTLAVARAAGAGWTELAPLHLCDAAMFVALWALLTSNPLAGELTYFWSAGSLFALLTPDLAAAPGDPLFLGYFAAHGGVVAAGALLPFGLRRPPRPGAALRAFAWTNAYAAAVLAVNLACSTNFLYLLAKPASPTPLDWFGPWPVYLFVSEALALGLFALMSLPWRRRAR